MILLHEAERIGCPKRHRPWALHYGEQRSVQMIGEAEYGRSLLAQSWYSYAGDKRSLRHGQQYSDIGAAVCY
jgi:hypothetical protein